MKVRAAVLNRMGAPMPYAESKPLSITEVDLDPPGPGEVLVKIAAAGLCHSDRYQRTAHRITSAVNCRPLNSLPCRMTPAPLSALSRRHVYPIRTRLTNLQQIPLQGATSYWACVMANSSGHMSHHGAQGTVWTLVAPNELARLASLQPVATRRLPRVQGGLPGWTPPANAAAGAGAQPHP